jgi:hypothetical protein
MKRVRPLSAPALLTHKISKDDFDDMNPNLKYFCGQKSRTGIVSNAWQVVTCPECLATRKNGKTKREDKR